MMRRRLLTGASRVATATTAQHQQLRLSSSGMSSPAIDSRDQRRNRDMHSDRGDMGKLQDPPDMTNQVQFEALVQEHVKVPELSDEYRRRSDMEKERHLIKTYGKEGPGEKMSKSPAKRMREETEKQQDIDGLPWEVRWRKNLIPTQEEIVQQVRDRFELFAQDPIDREVEWYLHWKDRNFLVARDRMIWPQGYTDYLEHYDECGRRRVLPGDQRWSNSSYKHLADNNYRNRMWLLEGEDKQFQISMSRDKEEILREAAQNADDQNDTWEGLLAGVIDFNPDQAKEVVAGTADPVALAKAEGQINAYGAEAFLKMGKAKTGDGKMDADPVTGLPKSEFIKDDIRPGVSVEMAALVTAYSEQEREKDQLEGQMYRSEGKGDPQLPAARKAVKRATEGADLRPAWTAIAEDKLNMLQERRERIEAGTETMPPPLLHNTRDEALKESRTQAQIEDGQRISDATTGATASTGDADLKPSSKASSMPLQALARAVPEDGQEAAVVEEASSKKPKKKSAAPPAATDTGYISLTSAPFTHKRQSSFVDPPSGEAPDWYDAALVNTQPMITEYNMVGDPLEQDTSLAKKEYYEVPKIDPKHRTSLDKAGSDANSFDDMKHFKEELSPETSDNTFDPLPMYREVVGEGDEADDGKAVVEGSKKKRSELLMAERRARVERSFDPEVMLPDLPWDSDVLRDPKRGVADKDAVSFHRDSMEKTWAAYRQFLYQLFAETRALGYNVTAEQADQLSLDGIKRLKRGEVGDHPQIHPEQEEVFQLVFQSHVYSYLSETQRARNHTAQYEVYKNESDKLQEKAMAKCKVLGPSMMNFINEMTAIEFDEARKNPMKHNQIQVSDKRFRGIVAPFARWMDNQLSEYCNTDFPNPELLQQHKDFLMRTLQEARNLVPFKVEDVQREYIETLTEAMHSYCRGLLSWHSMRKMLNMHLQFKDGRFRQSAETHGEDSVELFQKYYNHCKSTISCPIPGDLLVVYTEKDFLSGQNAVDAEFQGNFELAESIWYHSTKQRWYPLVDETDQVLFSERRGRLSIALDNSDRTIEALLKKTHPSIHPFPERAHVFLEGAPLTQETAEHLWMSHMADVHIEHSLLNQRLGRFDTATKLKRTALRMYSTAIREARSRLPPSWTAPILTRTKYLAHCYDGTGTEEHVKSVVQTVDEIYALDKLPRHWFDRYTDSHWRTALLYYNTPAIHRLVIDASLKKLGGRYNTQDVEAVARVMLQAQPIPARLLPLVEGMYQVTKEIVHKPFMRWIAKERTHTDTYFFLIHIMFSARVRPTSAKEIDEFWKLYEPVYQYMFSASVLASLTRGTWTMTDCLRRMCYILGGHAATQEHRNILLKELTEVQEKIPHTVPKSELTRCISTVVASIKDPSKPVYPIGIALVYRQMNTVMEVTQDPAGKVPFAAEEYKDMRKAEALAKRTQEAGQPVTTAQGEQQKSKSGGELEEPLGEAPSNSVTKNHI